MHSLSLLGLCLCKVILAANKVILATSRNITQTVNNRNLFFMRSVELRYNVFEQSYNPVMSPPMSGILD